MRQRLTNSRMNRLGKTLGFDPNRKRPCPGCRAPDAIVLRVVTGRADEAPKRCGVCNRYLDHDGAPLPDRFKCIVREPTSCVET
jgi:hypothetical protein